eukprot:6242731-Amphidinium_carterae.2
MCIRDSYSSTPFPKDHNKSPVPRPNRHRPPSAISWCSRVDSMHGRGPAWGAKPPEAMMFASAGATDA